MSGHTPGPWHKSWAQMAGCYRVRSEAGDVAEMVRDRDAPLIAAAPDLLEALGAIGVVGGGYCFCSHDRDPDKAEHQPECRGARAAIAKAEGKS